MPEKWAGFALQACCRTARFAGLPRSYVAALILGRWGRALWVIFAAVQRLEAYMLSNEWPDVAGYTYAETSSGLGVKIQISRLRFPASASTQERLNDQVQARVYLARRLYADAE